VAKPLLDHPLLGAYLTHQAGSRLAKGVEGAACQGRLANGWVEYSAAKVRIPERPARWAPKEQVIRSDIRVVNVLGEHPDEEERQIEHSPALGALRIIEVQVKVTVGRGGDRDRVVNCRWRREGPR
jgi:hypothetical protein